MSKGETRRALRPLPPAVMLGISMRILVTGSAGHLGEALMLTLQRSDHGEGRRIRAIVPPVPDAVLMEIGEIPRALILAATQAAQALELAEQQRIVARKFGGVDLKKTLAANSGVLLYVIDVGVEKPRNFALGELTLSGDVVPVRTGLPAHDNAAWLRPISNCSPLPGLVGQMLAAMEKLSSCSNAGAAGTRRKEPIRIGWRRPR